MMTPMTALSKLCSRRCPKMLCALSSSKGRINAPYLCPQWENEHWRGGGGRELYYRASKNGAIETLSSIRWLRRFFVYNNSKMNDKWSRSIYFRYILRANLYKCKNVEVMSDTYQ